MTGGFMKDFLPWIVQLLFRDERGEVGDDPADDTSDKDDKEDQIKDKEEEEEEEDDELLIDLDEKEDEEDEETKKKAEEAKVKDSAEVKKLRSELDTWKEKEKTWKRTEYQARKDREAKAKLETGKDEKPLTDAQLSQLLEDANKDDDTTIQLNVLKYLAQRIAKGEVKEAVNAAEMSRKADDFKKRLEEKFPDVGNPTSDMRADLDRVKEQLNIADHPYGDMFAVGFKLFEDMDALIEASFEAGKDEALKGTADEKRKKEIKAKSLPSSKKSPYTKTHGLSASQLETAQQMGLKPDQLPAYAKLVGRKPRIVSVEA